MTAKSGAHKDVRQLLKAAEARGCEVSRTKGGHWRISRPGCPPVTLSNTPSDARAMRNALADLKRNLGVNL